MEAIELNGCSIYYTPLESAGRAAEAKAVAQLVASVFGGAELSHHTDGSPYVAGFEGYISVSHGAGYAMIAVSKSPVGIDIEAPREQLERIRHKFINSGDRTPSLLHAWTAKEAAFKAAGIEGVTVSEISVDGNIATVRGARFAISYGSLGDALYAIATPI